MHTERAVPRVRSGDDHGLDGQRGENDRGRQGRVALPLRRLGQQAVLRRDALAHRIRGRRGGGPEGGGRAVTAPALVAALWALRLAGPLAPTLSVDLDGDGREEVVSAEGRRGVVRLAVRGADGARIAEAKAPAPAGDVVRVELSSGSLGSAGALVEVDAATDAARCVSVWRLRNGGLERVPMRDERGKELPDCAPPGGWTYRFERESGDRPSMLVRERTESTPQGPLHVREVFAFAGFSLDADSRRSTREIAGVAIPRWYDAVLYSTEALSVLNGR